MSSTRHWRSHKALSTGRCDGHRNARRQQARHDVTKPYQRAGVTDSVRGQARPHPLPGHKALSTGRCDGQSVRFRLRLSMLCHKALSTGRCDGHKDPFGLVGSGQWGAGHKALSTGRCDGPARSEASHGACLRHKALSTGRCDGPPPVVRVSSLDPSHKALSTGRCDGRHECSSGFFTEGVTKPYQRAGVTDAYAGDLSVAHQ